jgi:transposase-like protein
MGRKADGSVAAVWAERLARQQRGTLSIAEFCRREKISPPSFYAWRRRLANDARAVFVPVELSLSRAVEASAGVQIELPGGALVSLPAGASAELVTTAIRAAMHAASSEEQRPC